MPRKPDQHFRWSRATITRELGMDVRTVGKRLVAAGLENQTEFTTRQVFDSMLGDLTAERTREAKERADKLALENAEKRGELVSVKELAGAVNKGLESIRATIIAASGLEAEDKDKILVACRSCWDAAFGVSRADGADAESAASLHGKPVG